MTPSETDMTAATMALLRPDWTKTRIRSVVEDPRIQVRDARTAIVAAVMCATDPRATAPGFLLTDTATWAAARRAVNPNGTERPEPPKLVELCVCGRSRHAPMPVCSEPGPAMRQRPATSAQVEAAAKFARQQLREKRAQAKAEAAQAKVDARPFGPDYP